jgi:ribosomal protein S27AE
LRFTALLERSGERESTEKQRQEIRGLYSALIPVPLPHGLDGALGTASYEAAEAILGWMRCVAGRWPLKRTECPKCGAFVVKKYLHQHLKNGCLGSREAREAQEAQRAKKHKSICPDCGLQYNRGVLRYHLPINCPVVTLSTFLDRVGRKKATKEQIAEVRELYGEQVPFPMPQKLAERLDGTSHAVAESLMVWLRHRKARKPQERAE